jgi:hypothetical protein
MVVLPYIAMFEGVGPLLELAGYMLMTFAAVVGVLQWGDWNLLITMAVLFGIAATLTAVLMSDLATKRYLRGSDLLLLVIVALLENCGYRQLNTWWSCVGTVQALAGKSGWGIMKRRAFEGAPPS